MEPRFVDNPASSRFELLIDGDVAGFLEYQRSGSTVSLNHTVVDKKFAGRGLGLMLARGALDAMRAEKASVLPFCSFIRSYLQRNPAYLDLVPADQQARFELAPAATKADHGDQ